MDAYPDNNGRPAKHPIFIHAVIEAKGFIIKAYEKRMRKLDKYLKEGLITEEQYKALRHEFATNADKLLRFEVKTKQDYSDIRLKAVFDTADAHEFRL
ncbi:hypothetical protein [Longitalea luteola]|uniref:hypothetical protein n=1 Tax=Longitalea luteola TaxID=2812563 RepID=UPI001A95B33E|nr:hypothetical protein [Longitalea luteola]